MDSPTRRALLIGAQTGNLRGVHDDVARMGAALAARGFIARSLTGDAPTRAGILAGLAQLVADTRPGDAVVIYYAGHGGRGADVPYLVPVDHELTTDDDFRGVTSWELSQQLAALTAITRNVTAIFDCCHAAELTRGLVVRAIACTHPRSLARHLAKLRARGGDFDGLDPAGNPHAVRVFAAGALERAYETRRPDGAHEGLLTAELLRVLATAGDAPVTWRTVGAALTLRLRGLRQRPQLAGPVGRAPFTLDEPDEEVAHVLGVHAGRLMIDAGRLHGVREGDAFDLVPLDAALGGPAATAAVAAVTVTAAGWVRSEVRVDGARAPGLAYLRERAAPRDPRSAADALCALAGAYNLPAACALVTLLGVDGGGVHPLPVTGAALALGERLAIRVENRSPRTVHAHVFGVDAAGAITLLSSSAPHGFALEPGAARTVGERAGEVVGLPLTPPAGSAERIVVIAAAEALDLRALETGRARRVRLCSEEEALRHAVPVTTDGLVVVVRGFALTPAAHSAT